MRANYTDFNDADYVRRTLGGDKSAYDALVRQYHGMVFSVAMARLDSDYDLADELTQEVFLRAWLHLDRLSKPDYFPAWLVQITRNLAADWKRRNRRQSALVQMLAADHPEVLATPASDPSPREAVAAANEANELKRSLNQLQPEHRELLLLHYGEGLSQSGIARNLGVSPSTVMRRLEKALNNLKHVYKRDSGQELARSGQMSRQRAARTLAVMAAAFLLTPHQKLALAGAAGSAAFLPRLFSLKKVAAVASAGVAAAAVIVVFGNYGAPALHESGGAQRENSPRFSNRSIEVRSVDGEEKDQADLESGNSTRNTRQLLKSATAEDQATPKVHAVRDARQDTESSQRLASPDANDPQSGKGAAASADAEPSSSGCPTLQEMVERIRKMEAIAGSVHLTYRSAVTVLNAVNQPEVNDREGTVTVRNGRYLIEVRDNADHSQTIFYSPERQEVAAVVNPGRHQTPEQHIINIWTSPTHIAAQIRSYDPLAGLILPPYGPTTLSDFLIEDAEQGAVSVQCSPETTSSVIIESNDWSVRFQRDQYPFFDRLQRRPGTANGRILDRTVAEFSSLNGVIYPSLFYTNSFSDNGRFGGFENATTTSLTILKLGEAVPFIKDPFADLPNARRFEMETGKFISDSSGSNGQKPLEKRSTVTTASEPTLAQKLRDPQIAKQFPQPGMVTGQVVDPEGRPVPELEIDWAALTHQRQEERQNLLNNLPRNTVVSNQPVQQTGRSKTDANGNFVINFPTTGTAVLSTDCPPYARTLQVVDLPTTKLVISLSTQAATVEGIVRDIITGDPVPNAYVRLMPLGKMEFESGPRQRVQTFKLFAGTGVHLDADASGRFRDERMPAAEISGEAGTNDLVPVKNKYLNPENPVLTIGRVTKLPDLYVYPGYTLRGHVYEAGTSRPLAGVTLATNSAMGTLAGKRPQPFTTDASGYYEVTRLQPLGGDVRSDGKAPRLTFEYIYAEADGYKTENIAPRVEGTFNPQNLIIEHDFELIPGTEPEKPAGNLQRFQMPRL